MPVKLIGERLPTKENGQIRPYGIQRNILVPNEHEHLDLIYLAVPCDEDCQLSLNRQETTGIGWFSPAQVYSNEFDTFAEQKQWVKYFHQLMSKSS